MTDVDLDLANVVYDNFGEKVENPEPYERFLQTYWKPWKLKSKCRNFSIEKIDKILEEFSKVHDNCCIDDGIFNFEGCTCCQFVVALKFLKLEKMEGD